MTINIQHNSIEDWRNGPRVDIFTIEHKLTNPDGSPLMVPDPAWVEPSLEEVVANGVSATSAPLVQAVESTTYSMPEKPNAGFVLVYLKAARTMGAEAALGWLFELAIGDDAYDALAGESDFSMEDLQALMLTVQRRALGGLEAPKG